MQIEDAIAVTNIVWKLIDLLLFFYYYEFLKHRGRDTMAAILQTKFSSAFTWMKTFEFWIKFEMCSLESNWKYGSIGSNYGLVPKRQQAIM